MKKKVEKLKKDATTKKNLEELHNIKRKQEDPTLYTNLQEADSDKKKMQKVRKRKRKHHHRLIFKEEYTRKTVKKKDTPTESNLKRATMYNKGGREAAIRTLLNETTNTGNETTLHRKTFLGEAT